MKDGSLQKVSLRKSAVVLTSSKIVTYTISLVTMMLLSRFRTLSEFGTYSQILIVVNLMVSIFMLGLPFSLNYFMARAGTEEEKNKFLSLYYTVNTALSIVVGLIVVAIMPLAEAYFDNRLLSAFLYFGAVYPWTRIITSSVENLLIIFNKSNLLIAYQVAHSVALVLLVLVVQLLGWTFSDYMVLFLLVEIVFTIIVYYIANQRAGRLRLVLDKRMIYELFKFSVPLGLATAVGTLKAETDKLLIGYLYTVEELALYANAAREIPITLISASLTAVLLPQIARLVKHNDMAGAVRLWKDTIVLSLLINSFLGLGLFVFSAEAVDFLYSDRYFKGAQVFGVYSLTYIIRCTYYGMILNSSGNTKYILKSSVYSLVLNALLDVLFHSFFGFIGPAVATVVATAFGAWYLLYNTSKISRVPFGDIFPWKNSGVILLVNVCLGILFYLVRGTTPVFKAMGGRAEAFLLASVWAAALFLIFRKTIRSKWRAFRVVENVGEAQTGEINEAL